MYAGTTLTKYSGRLFGAHQKIDRIARRHLARLVTDDSRFPGIKTILAFEGRNGPDGIKRKSPAKDEPWHFFNPFTDTDSDLFQNIEEHYTRLVQELKSANMERSAFEAAWLAHAIVDGLTPAHHYPYEQRLAELRGGQGNESRNSLKQKLVMPGSNRREKVKNNWHMWGPRGLITSHGLFEFGVASIIKPLSFNDAVPTPKEVELAGALGVIEIFKRSAREIGIMDMYGNYQRKGWTPRLAWQVRHRLGPIIIRTVTLAWYSAMLDAGLMKGKGV